MKNDHPRNYNQLLQAVRDYYYDLKRPVEEASKDLENLRDEIDMLLAAEPTQKD